MWKKLLDDQLGTGRRELDPLPGSATGYGIWNIKKASLAIGINESLYRQAQAEEASNSFRKVAYCSGFVFNFSFSRTIFV